jgi:inorganic pyrophosphatase
VTADLLRLPTRDREGNLRAVVEAPRGARVKLKYDPELGAFTLARPLPLGMHYPYDWGFFPSTLADDGDPLDALVVHDARTWPGVVIACRPVAVLQLTQRGGGARRTRNDRVIVAPADAPRLDELRSLPERLREEIERFFLSSVFFENKGAEVEGWREGAAAEKVLREAESRFERAHGASHASEKKPAGGSR